MTDRTAATTAYSAVMSQAQRMRWFRAWLGLFTCGPVLAGLTAFRLDPAGSGLHGCGQGLSELVQKFVAEPRNVPGYWVGHFDGGDVDELVLD